YHMQRLAQVDTSNHQRQPRVRRVCELYADAVALDRHLFTPALPIATTTMSNAIMAAAEEDASAIVSVLLCLDAATSPTSIRYAAHSKRAELVARMVAGNETLARHSLGSLT